MTLRFATQKKPYVMVYGYRLARFLESAGTVLNFFEPFLGRIEIKTADKIERVYFEIDENNIEQV